MAEQDDRPVDPNPSEHRTRDLWAGLGHVLEGIIYPARPVEMIHHAQQLRRQERLHKELLERLQQLPDKEYQSPDEVRRHLDDTD